MAPSLAFVAPSPCLSSIIVPQRPYCPCLLHQKPPTEDDDDDFSFLQQELARIESLDATEDNVDGIFIGNDTDVWLDDFSEDFPNDDDLEELERTLFGMQLEPRVSKQLEEALSQGVVPANAAVASGTMTGDFNFDPLNLSEKDYIGRIHKFIQGLIPSDVIESNDSIVEQERPTALILRDYREAEIRHGRLAMLAAVFWPLQEMLDRFVLDEETYGSVVGNLVQGGVTLPYIPLIMTAIMLLLGYLDIFQQQLLKSEELGEAFLPGDLFWDPLQILQGAPPRMKRNMQERELFNGRMAMLGIAVFIWEEARTGLPLIDIPGNELLFEPAYQVPYIQEFLDWQFGSATPPSSTPPFVDGIQDIVEGVGLEELVGME